MSNREYPYYPAWDNGKVTPGIERLVDLCKKRWGLKNLGTYVNRDMRGKPGEKSVHATGAAADIGYATEEQARTVWDWFLANSKALGVCELHWYAYGDYGAGYRCSRGEGKKGVKVFTATDNAGSYEGNPKWLHIELSPEMCQNPDEFEKAFRALK
jgi:hypothetical protein